MGGFVDDCVDVINFSISWKSESWVVGMFAIIFILSLITNGFSQAEKLSGSRMLPLVALPVLILAGVITAYFVVKVMLYGLKKLGFGNIEFGPVAFINYIILTILTGLSALLPWMDTKLLIGGIVILLGLALSGFSFLVSIIGAAGTMAGGAGGEGFTTALMAAGGSAIAFVLFFLIGVVLWSYTYTRLFATPYLFLSGKAGLVESIRKSWGLTNGRFWKIFGTRAFFGICVGIVFGVIGFIIAIIGGIASIVAPIAGALLVAILMSVIQPVSTFVGAYGGVKIYSLIDKPGPAIEMGQTGPVSGQGPRPDPLLMKKSENKNKLYDQY